MRSRRAVLTWRAAGLIALGVMAGGVAASAACAGQPQGRVLEVTVEASRVTLRAREAPLADVLAAVGRKAGVKMVLLGDLAAPVTETFVGVPLDEAVRRLSRSQSIVLVYDGPPDEAVGAVLSEVWVTGSPAAAGGTTPDRVGRAAEEVQRNEARAADGRQQGPQARTPELTMALKYPASENRKQIIEAMVREQGAYAVVDILREAATRDPDPRVRRGAIRVLASMDSADAVDAVRATLRDGHPGVRSEALAALRRLSRALSSNGSVQ